MISHRNIRNISYITTRANPCWNTKISSNSVCRTKPAELIIRRNASIFTRNILKQKLKLDQINNWGIALIVSITISDRPSNSIWFSLFCTLDISDIMLCIGCLANKTQGTERESNCKHEKTLGSGTDGTSRWVSFWANDPNQID